MAKGNEQEEKKPVKINKWDQSALKNSLDDAARNMFKDKLEYVESHRLLDQRLLICTVAVGFSLLALIWDYLYPFPLSRPVLFMCSSSYFVLMGILTLYVTYIEKNVFAVMLDKDKSGFDPDTKWELSSEMKRFSDKYKLVMTVRDGVSGKSQTAMMEKSVGNFFDEEGTLCTDLFDAQLKNMHNGLNSKKNK